MGRGDRAKLRVKIALLEDNVAIAEERLTATGTHKTGFRNRKRLFERFWNRKIVKTGLTRTWMENARILPIAAKDFAAFTSLLG